MTLKWRQSETPLTNMQYMSKAKTEKVTLKHVILKYLIQLEVQFYVEINSLILSIEMAEQMLTRISIKKIMQYSELNQYVIAIPFVAD